MSNSRGRAAPVFLILLAGIVVAATNVLLYLDSLQYLIPDPGARSFLDEILGALAKHPRNLFPFIAIPLASALLVALALALGGPRIATPEAPPAPAEEAPPAESGDDAVLLMLAALQKEGRFIDFLEEDLTVYDDAQIGAAVRPIHDGCRQALREHITLERIYTQDEGSEIVVAEGFDPAHIRLTGNLQGVPPFRGTLQHSGWRATRVDFPKTSADLDATVLAPAEVEVG